MEPGTSVGNERSKVKTFRAELKFHAPTAKWSHLGLGTSEGSSEESILRALNSNAKVQTLAVLGCWNFLSTKPRPVPQIEWIKWLPSEKQIDGRTIVRWVVASWGRGWLWDPGEIGCGGRGGGWLVVLCTPRAYRPRGEGGLAGCGGVMGGWLVVVVWWGVGWLWRDGCWEGEGGEADCGDQEKKCEAVCLVSWWVDSAGCSFMALDCTIGSWDVPPGVQLRVLAS